MAAELEDTRILPVKAAIGGMITPTLKAAVQATASHRGMTVRDAIEEAMAEWVAKHEAEAFEE